MKGLELLESYPLTAKIVRDWFLSQMIESFKDDSVPEGFKNYMLEQGIENDKVAVLIDINPRNLFDVFDENNIHISIVYGDHGHGELNYCATINNSETSTFCLRRKDVELNAISTAFEILENKLTPKELNDENE